MFVLGLKHGDKNTHISPDRIQLPHLYFYMPLQTKLQMQQFDILWAHFDQHSPAFSLQLKHWHRVKLHHTTLAASECLPLLHHTFSLGLFFFFIGLEEHLVLKSCIVYTKQINK